MSAPQEQGQAAAQNPVMEVVKVEDAMLEGEALEETLRQYFEYYLSREYLAVDPFLVSQMNGDMFLPVTTLAGLVPIKADLETILNSIRGSTQLTLSNDTLMVKPNFKIIRNTVILRDIPNSTPVEEVKTIFSGEQCPPVLGIRPDIGDCWFVTFDTEEHALKALEFVRNQKFRDSYVKARIKSETLLRSLYQPASAPMPIPEGDPSMNMGKVNPYYYPSMGYRPPQSSWMQIPQGYQGMYDNPYRGDYDKEHGQPERRRGGGRGGGGGGGAGGGGGGQRKEYRNKSFGSNPAGGHTAGSNSGFEGQQSRGSGSGDDRKKRGRRGSRTEGQGKSASLSHTPPQLGLANFPPLLSSTTSTKQKNTGYVKDYAKFTREELIEIVSSLPAPAQKPASLQEEHCIAALSEPNTKLAISIQRDKAEGASDAAQPKDTSAASGSQGGGKKQQAQQPRDQGKKNGNGNAQPAQTQRKEKAASPASQGEPHKSPSQRKAASPAAVRSPTQPAEQQQPPQTKKKEEGTSSGSNATPPPTSPAQTAPAAAPAPGHALPTYAQAVSKPKEVTV